MASRFLVVALGGGEFPSVEKNHAEDAEDAPKEENDLSDGQPQLAPGDAPPGAEKINGGEVLDQSDDFERHLEDGNKDQIDGRMAVTTLGGVVTCNGALFNHRADDATGESHDQQ